MEAEDTTALLVLSFNGKGVVMLHRDLREGTQKAAAASKHKLQTRLTHGEERDRKRMAQVATIYTVNKRVWASLEQDPEKVIEEAFAEGLRRDPERQHLHRLPGQPQQAAPLRPAEIIGESHKNGERADAQGGHSMVPVGELRVHSHDKDLAWLDTCWAEGVRVASIVAWGGVGESALVNAWLQRIDKDAAQGLGSAWGVGRCHPSPRARPGNRKRLARLACGSLMALDARRLGLIQFLERAQWQRGRIAVEDMALDHAIGTARQARRRARKSTFVLGAGLGMLGGTLALWGYLTMLRMPGASYVGPFEPLSEHERVVMSSLKQHVEAMAAKAAAEHIGQSFATAGYQVRRQRYEVDGAERWNLEVEIAGARERAVVVVGARCDSPRASGTAALLALAKTFAGRHPSRTLRFVAFADEEGPPRGSAVYAKRCRGRDEDVTMLSLESLGSYTDQPGSQRGPFPLGLLFPRVGDFVAFAGDRTSASLVRSAVGAFRRSARFPSEGLAMPGLGRSDAWAFQREGYPAVMVTDTGLYRHQGTDTADKLAYPPMARVVVGLERVVEELAGVATAP